MFHVCVVVVVSLYGCNVLCCVCYFLVYNAFAVVIVMFNVLCVVFPFLVCML